LIHQAAGIDPMQQPLILWIDLTEARSQAAYRAGLAGHCRVRHCTATDAVPGRIHEAVPDIICFDFDVPGPSELTLLQKTKLLHPSIPILMFTGVASADLLIWALRSRVWDCFVKPVSAGEVIRRLNIMLPVLNGNSAQRPRKLLMPERTVFESAACNSQNTQHGRTAAVLPYLQEHLHEKLVLSDMARLCDMDQFEFSRTFRREQGVTFREHLLRIRIEAAAKLLQQAARSVLDVAYSVGFNDPSHFSRLFRRHMGVTPKVYRSNWLVTGGAVTSVACH